MGVRRVARLVRILALLALVFCRSIPLPAQVQNRIVAGIDRNYPPYEYVDPDGQPRGFNVDLIREVAKEQGWALEIRAGDWTDIRRAFERGDVDVLTGMSFSDERAKTISFSVPHSSLTCSIFVRDGNGSIESERDLTGKSILAQNEDFAYEQLVAKGLQVKGFPSPEEALKALSAGQGDCAVLAKSCALYFMRKDGVKNLKVVPGELFGEKYCFAFLKHRDFLRAQLNEGLYYLRENGKIDEIYARHLGVLEAREMPLDLVLRRSAVVVIPVILVIALIVVGAWFQSLKRLVKRRTEHLQRLNNIIETINQSMEFDQLLAAILRESNFIQGVESTSILVLDPERNVFRYASSIGWDGRTQGWETIELTLEEAEERYTRNTEVLFEDIFQIHSASGRPAEDKISPSGVSQSMLAVRIRVDQQIFGYLLFNNLHDPEAIQVHDLEMLKSLKEHLVLAFQKARNVELLEEAKTRAEKAAKFKSEFLASMSHEIRTPMNAILGFARLGLKLDVPPKANDYFRKIATAGQSLLGLINDILDLSKIEAGKLELESIPFHLSEVLEQVMDLLSVRAAEKDLELVMGAAPDVPDGLLGDPLRLGQVLVNLVGNALKFTESGFIRIRVEKIACEGERVRLRFLIQDSGVGMTMEQQARLFDAFSQGDMSTTRAYGGTGLGLAISRQLVEKMMGDISVTSEPGAGSTFAFTSEFGLNKEAKPFHETRPDLKDLNVLVVDDNELARDTLQELLQMFGFNVVAVESGEAALNELKRPESAFDLVIMDWKMPGMDGIETSRRIKEDPRFAAIPEIIMVTAFGREEVAKAADKAGIRSFLMKPVSPSLLLDTTLEALGRERFTNLAKSSPAWQNAEEAHIRGARVLVVDDNTINRQVAEEILLSAGAAVDMATTGPEAIRMVGENTYDAVLMDIQMPGMDGYEATAEVRKNPSCKDLPIIAMTAHALPGYREACLNAGMNDYVAKPVDPQKLFSILASWLKARPQEGPFPRRRGPNEQSVNDLPGIDVPMAMKRLGGNWNLLLQLLSTFIQESASSVADLEAALARKEWETAERIAHSLKGITGNLSAVRLQRAVVALELKIKQRDETNIPLVNAEFDQAFAQVIETARKAEVEKQPRELNGVVHSLKPRVDYRDLEPLLQRLSEQLRISSPDAEFPLQEFKEKLGGRIPEELHDLEECVATFNFQGAREALEKLMENLKRQAD